MNPFVLRIIESPSPEDIFDGRTEGRLLSDVLALSGIAPTYNVAVNEERFVAALQEFVGTRESNHDAIPILHLSMHGNDSGVRLTDGFFLTWDDIRDLLWTAAEGNVLLCMSSCFGFSGCKMAMDEAKEVPFLAIVGHTGEVSWGDAAVAYTAFYHRVFKGATADDALQAMRQASGDGNFHIISGKVPQSLVADRLTARRVQEIWEALDRARANLLQNRRTSISASLSGEP